MVRWIFCLLLFSTGLQAQDFFDKHTELMPFIQKTNQSLGDLTKVIARGEEVRPEAYDGGVELVGFYEGNLIRKIELSVGISYGNHHLNYYFRADSLYAVNHYFKQFAFDDETGSFDYSKTETTFDGYYLFSNPFESTHKGTGRYESENLDPETTLRKEAKEYLAILNKKRQQ